MHRDQQQVSEPKTGRRHARREWEPTREQQHQMEAREHSRQGGRGRRTSALRAAEAERQIRELAARY